MRTGKDVDEIPNLCASLARDTSFAGLLPKLCPVLQKSHNSVSDDWALAKKEFEVSRSSFDGGWTLAILDTGREDWFEPMRRRFKKQ